MKTPKAATAPQVGSQTLSRGLVALEILAAADNPITLNELATQLGVHRSNAYRILRTLEDHRFVMRDSQGFIKLGPKLTVLARGVAPALSEAVATPIAEMANTLGMTVFVSVLDADEVITIASASPTTVDVSIARRPGTRNSVFVGAPGHALEADLTPKERRELLGTEEYSPGAIEAQENGYAYSFNEVIDGVFAVAIPLSIVGEAPAAIAVAHFTMPRDPAAIAKQLETAAIRIKQNYH